MSENIVEIQKNVDKIKGWLSLNEGELLYNLASKCMGKGVIVEIGSWKGKSTVWLGKGSVAGNKTKVYAIDPHTGSSEHRINNQEVWTFQEFEKNIKNNNLENIVIPIVKTSEKAFQDFNKPIELIFIDGAHEYEYVKQDFELWYQKVINGGIMAFHDTTEWPGPKKVVQEKLFKSKNFKKVNFVDSITFGVKVLNNSIKDRIRNKFFLLVKNNNKLIPKIPKFIKSAGKFFLKKVILF